MRKLIVCLVTLSAVTFLSGCERDERRQGDIYLPEGDAAKGAKHFVSLGCVNCHSVVGAELSESSEPGPVNVLLGSRSQRVVSYGQIVTSIVNPSHKLSRRYRKDEISNEGESLMISFNDVMSVTQLTDLVAFLQSHYGRPERPEYQYPAYDYGSNDESQTADPQ